MTPQNKNQKRKFNKEEFEKDLKRLKNCSENNDCDDFFKHYDKLIKKVAHKIIKYFKLKVKNDRIEELYHEVVVILLMNERKILKKFDPKKRVKVSTYIYGIAFKVIYNILIKDPNNEGKKGGGKKKDDVDNGKENKEYREVDKNDDREGKEKNEADNNKINNKKIKVEIFYGLDLETIIVNNSNIIYELDDEKINNMFSCCFKYLSVLEKNIYKLSQEKNKEDAFISNFLKKSIGAVQTTKSRALSKMKECISQKLDLNEN